MFYVINMVEYAVALGSNLGDSCAILDKVIILLSRYPNIDLTSYSPFYKTFPIGPKQPIYYNGCVIVNSPINPKKLLEVLLNIEKRFGRVRDEKWGARTLDLDILLCEHLIIETPFLQIPHPQMTKRKFVLLPLCTIASTWKHPITRKTVKEHLQEISDKNIV